MPAKMQAVQPGEWIVRGSECIGFEGVPDGADVVVKLLYKYYYGGEPNLDQHVAVVRQGARAVRGRIAYIGQLKDRSGTWVGIALNRVVGDCDGTISELTYFNGDIGKAVFAPCTIPIAEAEEPPFSIVCGRRVRIQVRGQLCKGCIAYVGPLQGGDDTWVGVALDTPAGYCNGTVYGVSYFHTDLGSGLLMTMRSLALTMMDNFVEKPRGEMNERVMVASLGVLGSIAFVGRVHFFEQAPRWYRLR
jgi:hypothetical protein